jgi:hypothetical protein
MQVVAMCIWIVTFAFFTMTGSWIMVVIMIIVGVVGLVLMNNKSDSSVSQREVNSSKDTDIDGYMP